MENKKLILGLAGNPVKRELEGFLSEYINWLEDKNIDYILSSEFESFKSLSKIGKESPENFCNTTDIVLSFGGDGTLLNTVRLLGGCETPVLGVNMGGLGYLTAAGPEDIHERTEDLLAGRWEAEKRMVLRASIEDCDKHGPWYALNDIVIDKGSYSLMINLHTTIDGEFLNNYRADGIIVSTPTGSTGYNLSAGGPIIEPKMAGIIFTPLNPHSLSNRPLIISDDKTIRILSESKLGYVNINIDGQEACKLENGCTLVVERASFIAPLVNFEGRYFYQILRQKLRWGD
ncbi:MAG: NAD(+)/NADH kinase [Candidatus Electryonea clarkiae]|nr:NAD(+)/NADH kinase [Candidatus Electryonea clarkiae]MDP8288370.1 NAD(+)/NADH kinase [Candidatus Electryonea clarkiae]